MTVIASPAFEKLHGSLVSLGSGPARERPEIAPPAGLRILLPRIEPILAGRESADHYPIWATSFTHRQQSTHAADDLRPHLGLRIDEDKVRGVRKHGCHHGVARTLGGRLVGRHVRSEHTTREE